MFSADLLDRLGQHAIAGRILGDSQGLQDRNAVVQQGAEDAREARQSPGSGRSWPARGSRELQGVDGSSRPASVARPGMEADTHHDQTTASRTSPQ